MLYRIDDLAVDARSGYTRVVVEFWTWKADFEKGLPCVVVNDFYNNYRGDGTEPIYDDAGRIRVAGVFLPPWVEQSGKWVRRTIFDTRQAGLPSMIHEDLMRWWHGNGNTKTGDKRDPGFAKAAEGADPNAVLSRPDVTAMRQFVWTDE